MLDGAINYYCKPSIISILGLVIKTGNTCIAVKASEGKKYEYAVDDFHIF